MGILKEGNTWGEVNAQRTVDNYLLSVIDSISGISSIYLYDNYGTRYYVDKQTVKNFGFTDIKDANWYKDVISKNGFYILRLNGGQNQFVDPKQNYISFIRSVNDIKTQEQIGILIINIPQNHFLKLFNEIVHESNTSIVILDTKSNRIVNAYSDAMAITKADINQFGNEEIDSFIKNKDGKEYIISSLKMEEYDWRVISCIPFNELSKDSSNFYFITICVILLNAFMLFAGGLFVSRLITTPIKKLLNSMKGFEKGNFKRLEIEAGHDEIGRLKDEYNIMVNEIEKLIEGIIVEQKTKRKVELNILQEQIKPHFLYNTLDTLSYLALEEGNQKLFEALEALGGYYKASLSKGSEIVSIGEEIQIVKNYLYLQKLRYGDVFKDVYEIDDEIVCYKILKLVIQPLVENAIYHGIRPKGEEGIIKISAKDSGDNIILTVEDDGVGMTEEQLENILDKNIEANKKSFGLRGTIERLKIFYGIPDIYTIESSKHSGCKVTITIPKREMGDKYYGN